VTEPEVPSVIDAHGPDPEHPPGPELRRLADALRRVVDQSVRTEASAEVLAQAAAAIERAGDLLEPVTPFRAAGAPFATWESTTPNEVFPFSPVIGAYHPFAPPIECEVRDRVVHGRGVLGSAYEGPPGCVHGGFVAALFDEILGLATTAHGLGGGMTGTLTVVYRKPVPIHVPLTLEARITEIDGRKLHTFGTIHDGERLCAEGRAVFIRVSREKFADRTRRAASD
jgi:acyl-coenzyme A thioesterase PaaI-like protein